MTPPAAVPAPRVAPPRRPRRVSGPARPAPARRTPARPARVRPSLARPGLLDHRLLDRLLRGRAWIPLIASALIGIVAMQLWVLKLNAGVGRAIEHEAFLQRENATLSATDSELSAGDRVEQLAAARGMSIVAPGALHFLTVRGSTDLRRAVSVLSAPIQAPELVPVSTTSTTNTTEATAGTTGATASTTEATVTEANTTTTPAAVPSATAAPVTTPAGAPSVANAPASVSSAGGTQSSPQG
jgi:hypothetical protein